MAAFVMQVLGCEVAALNTVQFSETFFEPFSFTVYDNPLLTQTAFTGNHTGYRQFKGTRASAEEIRNIYEGLKQSHLTDFDVMLSGYAPSADAVEAVGSIGRDLKLKASIKPGAFFWGLSASELCCWRL
jgi:pyridoxine kinase